jgi:hypothetical protein
MRCDGGRIVEAPHDSSGGSASCIVFTTTQQKLGSGSGKSKRCNPHITKHHRGDVARCSNLNDKLISYWVTPRISEHGGIQDRNRALSQPSGGLTRCKAHETTISNENW